MRINKFLTEANYCSRRQADKLIREGRVKINTRKAKLGDQVKTQDKIFVGGKQIKLGGTKIYLAYNKPVGVITTTDKRAKDNIIFKISYPIRIYPVGRLDVSTSGLILLTNDGEIVNKILKAGQKVEKEYEVTVNKNLTKDLLLALKQGIVLDGHKTLPAEANFISDKKFSLVIVEGKNRQIRRMVAKLGYKVKKLRRIRIGSLKLSELSLRLGEHKELSLSEVKRIFV